MGHTNSTANLSLPQFIGTDKPTWLGDVNGAFGAIDTAVGTINADILAVDAKADNAVADASSAVTVANNASTTAGTASTTATTANNIANNALTVANNADGHTNQLEQKIGLLADLHTTDKTSIVNAINEVADGGSGSPSASAVSYDNTDSGLTATNVQDAIDELAQGGGGSVEVTADGVKTNSQLLDALFALIDISKLSGKSAFSIIGSSTTECFNIASFNATRCAITQTSIQSNAPAYALIVAKASGSTYGEYVGSYSDISSTVASSGTKFKIEY